MKPDDIERVEEIAELKVRQYFDTFLQDIFPTMMATHADGCPTGRLLRRCLWTLLGVGIGLAIAFPELIKLIQGLRL